MDTVTLSRVRYMITFLEVTTLPSIAVSHFIIIIIIINIIINIIKKKM